MQTSLTQPIIALAMIYAGVLLGIIYDIFRVFRRIFPKRLAGNIIDFLFILVAALFTICSFLIITAGETRAFTCILYALGFFLEQMSISYFLFRLWYTCKDRLQRSH